MKTEFDELDEAIEKLLSALIKVGPMADEYSKMADQLTKLVKAKEILGSLKLKEFDTHTKLEESQDAFALKKREIDLKEKEAGKPDRVSKETLAVIGGNLAGILLIISYERMNVIASKALSFVLKSR